MSQAIEHNITRRSLVAGVAAAIPATAVAAPALAEADPIFAAIEAHRVVWASYDDAARELDEAECAIDEFRPTPLIAWRNYSHIGWSEIDTARQRFLGEFPAWPAVAP